MKVLQINSVCGVGSTGRIATDIHKMLLELGHESYIAYGRGEAKNCNNSIRIGNNLDVLFHVLLTRLFDMHGFGSKRATKKFIKKVKEINPDVIHLHNIHGYYINIKLLFNYLENSNIPVIWTLHDCWAFTGHCSHFDYIGCEKWKTGCNKCPDIKSYPSSYLFDNSKNNYELKKRSFNAISNLTIITPSNWLSNLTKESFLKEKSINVINNGINLNIFKATESKFRDRYKLQNKFIILGIANIWTKKKGFDYFIELSKKLSDEYAFVMVGLNERQIKIIPENICGFKKTENISDLVEIYSSADVFVNMTLEDTFPTVNIESIACGTPVISFNTGGSPETIDSNCGIIVEKGDINMIVKEIIKVRSNNLIFNDIQKKLNNFDSIVKYYEYIKTYKSLKK